jgi:sulfatase maturation enzyme AslB (radical SAM superfamily)
MQANMNISMCPSLDDDFIFDSTIFKYYQPKCHICEYFMICNGCMKRIRDLQQTNFNCDELYKILTEFKSICLSK